VAAPKPVPFGVFNGLSFTPTRPIDVSKISEELLLNEFNRAAPGIGREVSCFIADQEVEFMLLQPGQPYLVFPKKFKRSGESRATVSDPIQPFNGLLSTSTGSS
jgi:hypothetical protein